MSGLHQELLADLALVRSTLDALGVEPGPLELRLAFLRGAAFGLRAADAPRLDLSKVERVVVTSGGGAELRDEGPAWKHLPEPTPSDEPAWRHLPAAEAPPPPEADPLDWDNVPDDPDDPTDDPVPDQIANPEAQADPDVETGLSAADALADNGHDPSWEDEAVRRSFFAALTAAHVHEKYLVIAAFCEAHQIPRPSAMTPRVRDTFLGKITNNLDARTRLLEWCGMHGPDLIQRDREERAAAAKARREAKKAERAAAKAAGVTP